jgi:hypothetical protein
MLSLAEITPRLVQLILLTQRTGIMMALEPSMCSRLVTAALCVSFHDDITQLAKKRWYPAGCGTHGR